MYFFQVIHFTSFTEMKNRKQHVVIADNENDAMDMALVQKDGGFFREGNDIYQYRLGSDNYSSNFNFELGRDH